MAEREADLLSCGRVRCDVMVLPRAEWTCGRHAEEDTEHVDDTYMSDRRLNHQAQTPETSWLTRYRGHDALDRARPCMMDVCWDLCEEGWCCESETVC